MVYIKSTIKKKERINTFSFACYFKQKLKKNESTELRTKDL